MPGKKIILVLVLILTPMVNSLQVGSVDMVGGRPRVVREKK